MSTGDIFKKFGDFLDELPANAEALDEVVQEVRDLAAEMQRRLNDERLEMERLRGEVLRALEQARLKEEQAGSAQEIRAEAARIRSELSDLDSSVRSALDSIEATSRAAQDRMNRLEQMAREMSSSAIAEAAEAMTQIKQELREAREDLSQRVNDVNTRVSKVFVSPPPSTIQVKRNGVKVGERRALNFTGAGVSVTDDRDGVIVNISGGGGGGSAHTIRENGTDLDARTGLNFTTGLVATDDSGGDETEVAVDTSVVYTVGGTDVAVADGGTGASTAADARSNLGAVGLTGNETIAGVKTFSSDPLIPDEAYDATAWNGSLEPPTKNAVRDKIEDILDGVTFTGDVVVPDEAYDATNWNGSLEVPTKNAVRDQIEGLSGTYAPLRLTIPADKTADYTATAADVNASTGVDSATAKTVTINTGVFTAGDLMEYRQVGAGQVTVAAGGGVTLRAAAGAKTRAQYSNIVVEAISSTVFSITGDVST